MTTIDEILNCPSASDWLKDALARALKRDLVDAAGDAQILAAVLNARLRRVCPVKSETTVEE